MDLPIINKRSSRSLALYAVFSSFFGGMQIERGSYQLLTKRFQLEPLFALMIGAAFLVLGLFWAAQLVNRTRTNHPHAPTASI